MSLPPSPGVSTPSLTPASPDRFAEMRAYLRAAMENERRMSAGLASSPQRAASPYAPQFPQTGGYCPPPPQAYWGFPGAGMPMPPPGMGMGMAPPPPASWQAYYKQIGLVPPDGFPEHAGVQHAQPRAEGVAAPAPVPAGQATGEEPPSAPVRMQKDKKDKRTNAPAPSPVSPPAPSPHPVPAPRPPSPPTASPPPETPKPRTRRATWSQKDREKDEPPAWNASTAVERRRTPSLASGRRRTASESAGAAAGPPSPAPAPAQGGGGGVAAPVSVGVPGEDGATPVTFSVPPNTAITISFAPVSAPAPAAAPAAAAGRKDAGRARARAR